MGRSDHVIRQGIRYDKSLVRLAEKWATEGVTTFGMKQSKALWEAALSGDKLTDRERETLSYIMQKYAFEESAKAYLVALVNPPPSSEGYYVVVEGKELQRALWDEAKKQTQDGVLDIDEAKALWALATADGEGVTPCEQLTIRTVLDTAHASKPARAFLEGELAKLVTTATVRVVVNHGATCLQGEQLESGGFSLQIAEDASVLQLKEAISKVVKIPADKLFLSWMEKTLGRAHLGDELNEARDSLSLYSIAYWMKKFPDWYITCKMLPPAPLPPGEAIRRTVKNQFGRDV